MNRTQTAPFNNQCKWRVVGKDWFFNGTRYLVRNNACYNWVKLKVKMHFCHNMKPLNCLVS